MSIYIDKMKDLLDANTLILQSLCLGTRSEMRNVDNAHSCQYASVDVSSIE